jgi:hypothetical protein
MAYSAKVRFVLPLLLQLPSPRLALLVDHQSRSAILLADADSSPVVTTVETGCGRYGLAFDVA